jgi:hypothetical protein
MEQILFGFTVVKDGHNRFKISCENGPPDMIVTIKKEGNGFRAVCNYSKWERQASGPYQAMHLHETVEQTLKELLISLRPDPQKSLLDFCWVPEKQNFIILGNGDKLLYNEFKK